MLQEQEVSYCFKHLYSTVCQFLTWLFLLLLSVCLSSLFILLSPFLYSHTETYYMQLESNKYSDNYLNKQTNYYVVHLLTAPLSLCADPIKLFFLSHSLLALSRLLKCLTRNQTPTTIVIASKVKMYPTGIVL